METQSLSEALTIAQRAKRRRIMRRMKSKIKRGRERAKRRMASKEVLTKRSRRGAINLLRKKFSKGKSYSELPYASRQNIDKRISKMKSAVDRIARKLLPKIRKKEMQRKKG